MPYMLVRISVRDYEPWKASYDENAADRKALGVKSTQVFRDDNEPGRVVVLLEWDTLENARRFAHSDTYLEARQRAGVIEPAEFTFLDRTENLTY